MTASGDRPAVCPRCGATPVKGSPLGGLCPQCLLRLALDAPDDDGSEAPDTSFGAYRLVEKLGEGGMGVVWLAQQDRPIRRRVALKVVKRGSDSTQVLGRFESERQALAILNHPHIATVFDAGVTSDGRPFFVMEYVAGEPITAYADRRALPIAARLELFLQVCAAVEHAHQKGVIHRDLKPTNILVAEQDGRPVVKVIDFGVAKALGPQLTVDTLETQIGTLLGTPEYMSPEQAGLSDALVDTRTDIYSLGLVLYELLVGALPFDARDLRRKALIEMLRVIREDEPPRLTLRLTSQSEAELSAIARRRLTDARTLLRQLRGDLEWITRRAIEKEPARRYPSASALAADVRHHLASEPVLAGPPGLGYRLGKLARRHRAATIAAFVALAAIVAGAVTSTSLWIGAERARRENRERLKTLHVTRGLQLAGAGNDLEALPWLVRALQLEEGGTRAEEMHRIRIRQVLDRSPYPLRVWQHQGLVNARLAPQRQTLATWDRGGVIRVWDTASGATVGPALAHSGRLADVQLTGFTVVTADAQGVARVWDARTGKVRGTALVHGRGLHIVRVAEGANRLLTADTSGLVRIWALDTGALTSELKSDAGLNFADFLDEGRLLAVSTEDGAVAVADASDGRIVARLKHHSLVAGATMLASGRLAATSRTGIVRVWSLPDGAEQPGSTRQIPSETRESRTSADGVTFTCGDEGVTRVSIGRPESAERLGTEPNCEWLDISTDGLLAAWGSSSGSVRTWHRRGRAFTPALPHPAGVLLTGFLRDTRQLLTVDSEGVVRVWELGPAAPAPAESRGFTWRARFSPDGKRIALASGSSTQPAVGAARVLDAETREPLLPPLRHGSNVRDVLFSADGRLIVSAAMDETITAWDAADGEPVMTVRHPFGVGALTLSPDSRRLVTLGFGSSESEPAAILWDVPTGRRIATVPVNDRVFSARFSEDGRQFLTVTAPPARVQVWRAADGGPVSPAQGYAFDAASFAAGQTLIMAGAGSIEARTADGALAWKAPGGVRDAVDMSAVADGSAFIVATGSGLVHVMRGSDPVGPRFPPVRLPGAISSAAVSLDGRWFGAASWQRSAQIWSAETGEPVTPPRALGLLPLSISFTPDGSRVQVSGADSTVWDLRPDDRPLDALERLAQLLSGHELAGTQLVPLPVARLVALTADPQLSSVLPRTDVRNWGLLAATPFLFRRDWHSAERVLGTIAGAAWDAVAARGHALAEMGRWPEARAAFAAARKRRPDWTELLYYEALASAAGGDASAVEAGCAEGLKTSGSTRNPDRAHWLAALCGLTTDASAERRAQVRHLARLLADVEPDVDRHLVVYASALVASGENAAAVRTLERIPPPPGPAPSTWHQRVESEIRMSSRPAPAARSRMSPHPVDP